MEIESDPRKAALNLKKHRVSFEEAATVLYDPAALVREDIDSIGENRWVLVGMSEKDRLVTVVYTLRNEDTIRLYLSKKGNSKRG